MPATPHYGMFTRAGNRAVDTAVLAIVDRYGYEILPEGITYPDAELNAQNVPGSAIQAVQDAVAALGRDTRRDFGEVYDTAVREGIAYMIGDYLIGDRDREDRPANPFTVEISDRDVVNTYGPSWAVNEAAVS